MESKELDKYIMICLTFSGRMNFMANSIDIVISPILEKLGCNLNKTKMLGSKIRLFENSRSDLLSNYSGNFDDLVEKLKGFNGNWNITKHGVAVGNINPVPTFQKDGIIYGFDQKKIKEIDSEFTEIMSGISEIWNKILHSGFSEDKKV